MMGTGLGLCGKPKKDSAVGIFSGGSDEAALPKNCIITSSTVYGYIAFTSRPL